MDTPTAARQLTAELQRIFHLQSVLGLLQWDEQALMPSGAASYRAAQLAALADLTHREFIQGPTGRLLETLEARAGELDADTTVLVRETRREWDRATRLPSEFVPRKASLDSRAYHAWHEARAARDFAHFAPLLQEQLDTAREQAGYLGCTSGEAAYDYFLDLHDPGLTAASVGPVLEELCAGLQPIVAAVVGSARQKKAASLALRGFPVEAQRAFAWEIVQAIGFDPAHGRLDTSAHPFCSGHGGDIRMTTRYHVDNPLDSLFSTIHETGHALYEQGLPRDLLGTPLGQYVGMAVHESQSRLWENQVARSRPFWAWAEPRYRAAFGPQLAELSSDDLYLAINAVEPQPIRVDADELHYNLHILLRFRMERALFSGQLAVCDLPEAWNAAAAELLGLTPAHVSQGCLQDVHWSGGAFGYFPSYSLGNLLAAQLWETVQAALPDLEAQLARGEFGPLLQWLRQNIHAHGKRYRTHELTRLVTGRELSPQPLLNYLRQRYLPLYT